MLSQLSTLPTLGPALRIPPAVPHASASGVISRKQAGTAFLFCPVLVQAFAKRPVVALQHASGARQCTPSPLGRTVAAGQTISLRLNPRGRRVFGVVPRNGLARVALVSSVARAAGNVFRTAADAPAHGCAAGFVHFPGVRCRSAVSLFPCRSGDSRNLLFPPRRRACARFVAGSVCSHRIEHRQRENFTTCHL